MSTRRRSVRPPLLRIVALCVGVSALLSGCAGPEPSSAPAIGADSAPALDSGMARSESSQSDEVDARRSEIVTATITLKSDDPIAATQTVADIVGEHDGRVDSRFEQPRTDSVEPVGSLTVRVPTADVDQVIEEISNAGTLVESTLAREDVTLEVQDLDARIGALQTSADRLRDLIAQATSTSDLIAAESALTSRQSELDSLRAQQRYLSDQVAMATISVSIATPTPREESDSGFLDGLRGGWDALLSSGSALIGFVGALIPWAVFFGIVAVIFYGVRRAVRKAKSG